MSKVRQFLVLPSEISDFERSYLARVNRIVLVFFALHVPALVLIASLNDTGPLLAALLTFAVLSGPLLAGRAFENPRHVSVIHGITAMLMGGLLVHFGQGPVQIEMHFYFFALIAMCAIFGNPLVIVAAAITVALHHLIVWLALPTSVFNYAAEWWVVAVHAAFVVLESAAACFISRSFFDNVIGLEKIVQARTQALDAKNRDMRFLLDHVEQGFLTIDRDGRLASERSAAVDAWFGAPAAGATWIDYLTTLSPAFAERTRVSWGEFLDGVMPIEVTLGQMPQTLTLNGTHFRFEYRPMGSSEPYQHLLVIISDVTMQVAREQAELEQREGLALFERVLADRSGFDNFVEETTHIIDVLALRPSADLRVGKRLLHTLKGNSALYGLSSIADECHRLEDLIAEEGVLPPPLAYGKLVERWTRLAGDIQALLGTRPRSLEIDDRQYAELERAVRTGESGAALLGRVRSLKFETTERRLGHIQDQAMRIAERLGKDVRVEIEDHGVRLDLQRWSGFWSALVHALRNALDHGLESREERVAAGKTAPGTVVIRTRQTHESLVVEIADNGRGVDWSRVAARAESLGLPAVTPQDLEAALFVDGLSTAAKVSDVSGRGIGMGALLAATNALGGRLSIHSAAREGTTVRFTFPPTALRSAESLRRGEMNHGCPE